MPILDAAANEPLGDKLLSVAARAGTPEFHPQYQKLHELHGHEEIHRAADELEQNGLIEWPDRKNPSSLVATKAGHAHVHRS